MARFKVGERARIRERVLHSMEMKSALGRQCTIVAVGPTSNMARHTKAEWGGEVYEIEVPGVPQSIKPFAHENALEKLLPDSDTYHPATASLDDLMKTVRKQEVEVSE